MKANCLRFVLVFVALVRYVACDHECAARDGFKKMKACKAGQHLYRELILHTYTCGYHRTKVCTREEWKQECRWCQEGKFRSIAEDKTHCFLSCSTCPLGLFSYSGHGHCEACDTGRAVPDSVSVPRTREHCAECPHGKYTAHTCQFGVNEGCWGPQQCLYCQAGKQDTGTGQNGCVDCGVGTSSGGGASGCATCPDGSGSPTAGGSCSPCTVGASSSNLPTAIKGVCTVCMSGFESDSRRVSCVSCTASFFSNDGVLCKECPNGEISGYNGDFTRCEVCRDIAKPSRPQGSGQTVCTKCLLGEWFDVETRLCALIPEAFLRIDSDNTRTVVMLPSVQGNDAISKQSDALEMYYVHVTNPTDLIQAPPNHFVNLLYEVQSCDHEDSSAKYTFLDRCGPHAADMTLNWVKARRDGVELYTHVSSILFSDEPLDNIRSKGLPGKYFLIEKKGREIPCQPCEAGFYNSKCRANQGTVSDGCVECVRESTCAPHEFLFHKLPQRCGDARALTDTQCRQCQKIRSTAPNMHHIVVGCGKTPLPRWNGVSYSIDQQKTVSECDYSAHNPHCRDEDGSLFIQETDHEGFASRGPLYLAYCPPGHFINSQHAQCDSNWRETWDIDCCQHCVGCGTRQKRNRHFVECSGVMMTDTQVDGCTDTCSPGFFEKDEDGATSCAQCRRSCA